MQIVVLGGRVPQPGDRRGLGAALDRDALRARHRTAPDRHGMRADGLGQALREWSVQRVGENVLLLAGAPPALRATLQAQVWAEWRVAGKRVRPPASRPAAAP